MCLCTCSFVCMSVDFMDVEDSEGVCDSLTYHAFGHTFRTLD